MKVWLGLILFSQLVQARVTTENLVAPNGYRWESQVQDDKIYLNLINQDTSQKTNITYAWAKSGVRILEKSIDTQNKTVTVKPGRHIWEPHPGTQRSLEEVFLNILKSLGYKTPQVEYVNFDGTPSFSTIDDFLNALQPPAQKLAFNDFIKSISQKVSETRTDIQKRILPFGVSVGVPQFLDIVEPIKGEENGHPRYDAFNLLVLKAYAKYGDHFLEFLNSLGNFKSFNPIFFYLRNHTVPLELKQVALALLTHNHLVEVNLVKAIILNRGPRQAWLAFKAINNLYAAERNWWQVGGRDIDLETRPQLRNIFELSHIEFLNSETEIAVRPRFLEVSCSGIEVGWVPKGITYHLYGAFLVSLRMKSLGMANWMVDIATPKLGTLYKLFSGAGQTEKVKMIQEVYAQGARYANHCR